MAFYLFVKVEIQSDQVWISRYDMYDELSVCIQFWKHFSDTVSDFDLKDNLENPDEPVKVEAKKKKKLS